jgi:hypothetical protein
MRSISRTSRFAQLPFSPAQVGMLLATAELPQEKRLPDTTMIYAKVPANIGRQSRYLNGQWIDGASHTDVSHAE